jgi:RHS repeat-associated protein
MMARNTGVRTRWPHETFQSPGDKAAGATVENKIAYTSNGVIEKIVDGTGESSSLTTTFNYTGSETYSKVEPSSIQTPLSEGKQKASEHTTFYGYNANGNVTSINQGTEKEGHPELKIERNSLGQPTSSTDGDGNKTKYEYNTKHDTLNRVRKAVTEPSGGGAASLTSSYKYDEAGNMTENHTYSPTTTYSQNYDKYNAANEICAIATSAPSACASPSEPGIAGEPTYDTDGDMTSDGSTSPAKFAFTERDQLSSITPHGGSATAIVSHGTGQEDLAAIGSEEVIQNALGVASTGTGESATYYTRDSNGQLLAKRKPGEKPSETQYYLPDPFGSPAMLTNSTGTQTAPTSGTYQYDPYGKSIGTGPSTFGYHSGLILPDGLIHYGARYYDPVNANWTQQDPLNQIGSTTQGDRFLFAGSDPINLSDPRGLSVEGEVFNTALTVGSCTTATDGPSLLLCEGSLYNEQTESNPTGPVEEFENGLKEAVNLGA